MQGSSINKKLSLEYMQQEPENKYFDRKSVKIRPSDLGKHISAFANADGGTIVIGIDDKTRMIEGVDSVGQDKINDFINSPKNCCKPMPKYDYEFVETHSTHNEVKRLLLLHISESVDQVIRTANDETWLRIGDRSVEMLGENLINLEYAKSARHYEDEINEDAGVDDLDGELLAFYKNSIDAGNISNEQLLRARGFIKNKDGKNYLTNAAVLLFAKNIYQFYPNCRIRFIRYDGNYAGVGRNINIIRDKNIELPLLKIIDEAKDFISNQLREFTLLEAETGRFKVVPEYPEFAWQEGIVNAVAHREYALVGSYIKVSMYDDRLEIESPGKLPNIVTVDNIKDTRYSRNPRISRVLTEFGWVRELNEGVKRIYSDMESFFLDPPVYSEPDQAVRLVLKNNIVMRSLRQNDRVEEFVGAERWGQLDNLEHAILSFMIGRGAVKSTDLKTYTGKSVATVMKRLNHLIEEGLVIANGNKYDPNRTYEVAK